MIAPMSDFWIYDVDEETLAALQARAVRNGRTAEDEARDILERAFRSETAPSAAPILTPSRSVDGT